MDLTNSNGSRRRSSRRSRKFGGEEFLRSERFGRLLFYGMLACLAVYLLVSAAQLRRATMFYDVVPLGSTQDDVRYGYGRPNQVFDAIDRRWATVSAATPVDQHARWAYALPSGGRLEVRFDGGRASRVSCTHPEGGGYACAPTLGIRLGDLEDDVAMRIGDPTRYEITGTTKTMWYDDLGLELKLLRFRVVAVALDARQQGLGAKIMRYFRTLVP